MFIERNPESDNSKMATVRTTCPYCGVGCGIVAKPDASGGAEITGDLSHPANFGRLCSKGAALGETLGLETRVLQPMMRDVSGTLARTTWDTALYSVAAGFKQIAERDGPGSVAFYLSGQLLTEDYYIANKLMKGFIGGGNVDTNSRLCMASSVAGHKRAFGADVVPGCYEDLDEVDLIVLVGSNAAWCHPVLFQRMLRNKRERGAKIVVIDPRRTATAEDADLHLPIAPGMDTVLFSALLVYLQERGAIVPDYIAEHTDGYANAFAAIRDIAPDPVSVAARCGLSPNDIMTFFDWFQTTEKTVTCYSQGVNQSAQGTDKVNAIINCHLATARIGKPGMGPFSLTGQPNAMGGREVGGLANQLAAHMTFTSADIDRVGRFWNAPNMAQREGLKAVDMFEAIESGTIKALWVMGTNPAVSLPRAKAMADAMARLELFVVSDNVRSNDTINAGAHILLPAAAWGEKDGTVTNSERRISRQRPFLPLPGEAKPDWWIAGEVAKRMGFGAAFDYEKPADIFREHAALSAFENAGTRAFDLSGFEDISDDDYDALEPFQWSSRGRQSARMFEKGEFFTADGKARFIAPDQPALALQPDDAFPLLLNTGRLRDQWHTMTRTGLSPRLSEHAPEPVLEVSPADAAHCGLANGSFARVASAHGTCILRVKVSAGQNRGSVFAPIHWNGETAPAARIGDLVGPAADPYSGQPESKGTRCAISPVILKYQGLLLTRKRSTPPYPYVARVPVAQGHLYAFASDAAYSHDALSSLESALDLTEYRDDHTEARRLAGFAAGQLQFCIFYEPGSGDLPFDSLKNALARSSYSLIDRLALLSGCTPSDGTPAGRTVCACFGVGLNAIRAAIFEGCSDAADVGAKLKAGTNCGSCQPEIRQVIREIHASMSHKLVDG